MEFFENLIRELSKKKKKKNTLESRLDAKIVFSLLFFIIVGQPCSQDEEEKP